MLSKIRKMDTEKLNKYMSVINKCWLFLLIALIVALIAFAISIILKRGDEMESNVLGVIVLLIFLIGGIAAMLEKISEKFSKELSFRKSNETIAILSSAGTKKVRLNDLESVNLNQLLEICEAEATYNPETETIFITFVITGDEGSTKISKTVEFKKDDDFVSKIEII
jgi:glucan phosphoethanolaminetransferase (alkaline phosphatase superfamily)